MKGFYHRRIGAWDWVHMKCFVRPIDQRGFFEETMLRLRVDADRQVPVIEWHGKYGLSARWEGPGFGRS